MRFLLRPLAALVFAAVLGLGSAYVAAHYAIRGDSAIENGPWNTSLVTGGANADAYTRAFVAITSVLALNKDETIYFVATRDSAGDTLDGNCSYRVEGRDPDTRWWSITAYGNDHFLIDTPSRRYSISKTNVVRGADGAFTVRLSTVEEAGNWIATSADGFQIMLRLYNPGASVKDDPANVPLPAILKESCS